MSYWGLFALDHKLINLIKSPHLIDDKHHRHKSVAALYRAVSDCCSFYRSRLTLVCLSLSLNPARPQHEMVAWLTLGSAQLSGDLESFNGQDKGPRQINHSHAGHMVSTHYLVLFSVKWKSSYGRLTTGGVVQAGPGSRLTAGWISGKYTKPIIFSLARINWDLHISISPATRH